jgi:hypothetical protein
MAYSKDEDTCMSLCAGAICHLLFSAPLRVARDYKWG